MSSHLDKYRRWRGSVDEFSAVLVKIGRRYGLSDDAIEPNARLVRDYAQRGILTAPERVGRDAVYGFRQILEFLAARMLVRDGWPLAKIAEHLPALGEDELLALVEGHERPNRALSLVQRFQRSRTPHAVASRATPYIVQNRVEYDASLRDDTLEIQASLQAPGDIARMRDARWFEITPWLHVVAERRPLDVLTPAEAEALARAIVAALLEASQRKGES